MNVALYVMAYMVGGLVFRKNVDVVLTSDVSCFHRTFGIKLKLEECLDFDKQSVISNLTTYLLLSLLSILCVNLGP